jgi:hypothetical protein
MSEISLFENRLSKCEEEYSVIFSEIIDYIKQIRKLTTVYIDDCALANHINRTKANDDECRALCFKYISRLYEIAQTPILSRLVFDMTSLFILRDDSSSSCVLSDREKLDFVEKTNALVKKYISLSETISNLQVNILPGYLGRLSNALDNVGYGDNVENVENGEKNVNVNNNKNNGSEYGYIFAGDIPRGFILTLDAIIASF